jgi:hypothetical protein
VFAVLEAVPEIVIVLLFATAFAAILAFLPLAGSRVFHISIGEQTSDAMQRAQTAVTGFTAIVTAFSLVQAQITLANIQKLVSTEADQMNQLDRLLTRYGDPSVGRIRETLRAYAESVVRDEWPELGRGRGSPITARLFTPLSKSILAIDPSPGRQSVIYTDMLKNVRQPCRIAQQSLVGRTDYAASDLLGCDPAAAGLTRGVRTAGRGAAWKRCSTGGSGFWSRVADWTRIRPRLPILWPDGGFSSTFS